MSRIIKSNHAYCPFLLNYSIHFMSLCFFFVYSIKEFMDYNLKTIIDQKEISQDNQHEIYMAKSKFLKSISDKIVKTLHSIELDKTASEFWQKYTFLKQKNIFYFFYVSSSKLFYFFKNADSIYIQMNF